MANITKRVNKRCGKYLDGEGVEIAILCEMKGALGAAVIATVLATRATGKVLERRTATKLANEGGIAGAFPAQSAVALLTPTRFMVVPSNGMTFAAPELIVDRSDVVIERLGRKGLGQRVAFIFGDDTAVEVDVGLGHPLKAFVEALAG